jgi:hypothetical protein
MLDDGEAVVADLVGMCLNLAVRQHVVLPDNAVPRLA